jgi:ceramide glucosyltransferase
MPEIYLSMAILGVVALAVAASHAVLTLAATLCWRRQNRPTKWLESPPTTVLKPLCGAEAGLYENLRTFCEQDYPEFQIVFGIGDATDPALRVVRRLQTEFPSLAIDVVVSARQHGRNRKVSNLLNMLECARYDVLVMADSDCSVGPDYLATVTAPLSDPEVGLVTCLSRDVPTRQIWSRLGAMYINEWYMPAVILAWLFGHTGYASGQTLCIRRDTMQAVGGLQMVANHLAEDNQLGELVREQGYRIVLSPYQIKTVRDESTLGLLTEHELRWMRTLQILRPRSFRLLFLSFSLPLAALGGILASAAPSVGPTACVLLLTAVLARLVLHFLHRLTDQRRLLSDLWLLPARELFICWIWCRTFFISHLTWRGSEFDVGPDGIMRNLS